LGEFKAFVHVNKKKEISYEKCFDSSGHEKIEFARIRVLVYKLRT